ncbi:MAG TPA: PfkB family carbohydrate kinase [Noviherbaspirillum sp.]|nr:PfkB family carbohydrate kinase [Noviherbaspirillum sp.]
MNEERRGHVLALGSINADFQMRVARRPEISETLIGKDFLRLGGGKSANVALIARRLGLPSLLLAHVGDDDLAEQALAPLRDAGVDISGVSSIAGEATGVAFILVPPDGKKGIVMCANANDAWRQADLDAVRTAMRGAPEDSVLVTNGEIPAVAVEEGMRSARSRGITTVLDPSPADKVGDALLRLADVVTPNSGEAETLTGIACDTPQAARRAAQQLMQRGASAAAVKLADGGCLFADADGWVHIGTTPVRVVDTTGAGDAFAGAFASLVARGASWREAARFAVAAAHLAVGGYGSQPSYPEFEPIRELAAALPIMEGAHGE